MSRTVNGNKWELCESEGFWWRLDSTGRETGHNIRRSDTNINDWHLYDGCNFIGAYDTMKQAMQSV